MRYSKSAVSEIHQRVGKDIPLCALRYQLNQLVEKGVIVKEGEKKGTKYFIDK
jgi:repressor of nif and glnA expression